MPGACFPAIAISEDYDHDEMTEYGHYMPDAVLQALSTQEVSAVLKYCNERNIAVTPRGTGTGLCGGCVAKGWRRGAVHREDEACARSGHAEHDRDAGAGRAADGVPQSAGRHGPVSTRRIPAKKPRPWAATP